MTTSFSIDLSDKAIIKFFGRHAFDKGIDYQKEGAVKLLPPQLDEGFIVVRGSVQGTQKRPYSCDIVLQPNSSNGAAAVISTCSCPVKQACKHLVALLCEFREQYTKKIKPLIPHPLETPSAKQRKTPQWQTWVESFNQTPQQTSDFETIIYTIQPSTGNLGCGISKPLKTGKWGKPKNIPQTLDDRRFNPIDREIINHFQSSVIFNQKDLYQTGLFPLEALTIFSLMPTLLQTKRCFLEGQLEEPLWQGKEKNVSFQWEMRDGKDYKLQPRIEGIQSPFILLFKEMWYIDRDTKECGKLCSSLDAKTVLKLLSLPIISLKESDDFLKNWKKMPIHGIEAPPLSQTKQLIKQLPQPLLILKGTQLPETFYYTREPTSVPLIDLQFFYGEMSIPIHFPEPEIHRLIEGVHCVIKRDLIEEKKYLKRLTEEVDPILSFSLAYRLPPAFQNHFSFEKHNEKRILDFLKSLTKNGWAIKVDPSFPCKWVEEIENLYADIEEIHTGSSWFDLNLGIVLDGEKINLSPILQRLIEEHFTSLEQIDAIDPSILFPVTLKNGRKVGLPGERLKYILKVLFELYDPRKKTFSLNKTRAAELGQLQENGIIWKKPNELKAIADKLLNFKNPNQVTCPASLQATLRPYQQAGINWLQYLRDGQFGGILADDMGLGKTIQTLSHLLIEKEAGRMRCPSLIVAPTSLMSNWKNEAARFAPTLKLLVLHGNNRKEDFSLLKDYDVIVTTYPLLVRDEAVLVSQPFYYLILDEAQFVKNNKTKGYDVLVKLHAEHRLCLTGTPMENNLGDLWSLFHFINPGLLGDLKQFNRVFRTPIEKSGNTEQQNRLAKRVAPFLLRRKKDEVAIDLPAKTEIIRKITLDGAQRDLYETLRSAMLEKIKNTVKEKGISGSQIIILDALLKMRQVCCDPRLVKLEAAKSVTESAKFEHLFSLLEEILSEGRKALLFSSFTSMLALIENELIKRGVSYAKLTGETKNREEVIRSFQEGTSSLFLISLKAGGTGLNLTAADTVIHYDPWWNPAAENQATDRAHRLGQQKPVFVYKLISEGTIEEKILALQQKKQVLIQNLFAENGGKSFSLSADEIEDLFQPLA